MTQDVPALSGVLDGRQYRAWDGSVWPDRDSRDVHNHTHPAGGVPGFAPMSWKDDERWGSIEEKRSPVVSVTGPSRRRRLLSGVGRGGRCDEDLGAGRGSRPPSPPR
jgi:hypothetical protein